MRIAPGAQAVFEVTSVTEAILAAEEGAGAVVVSVDDDRPVQRMADSSVIMEIRQRLVGIPVMVKVRVGHVLEARIAASMRVDYIDENELLSQVDPENFIDKNEFQNINDDQNNNNDESKVRFVCGCENLALLLRRVNEGAKMIRIQGGNLAETVRNVKRVMAFKPLLEMSDDEVNGFSKVLGIAPGVILLMKRNGGLPVAAYASGGIFNPADAALMMQMGCGGVFVGSDIFKFPHYRQRIRAIVTAVKHPQHYLYMAHLSRGLEPILEPVEQARPPPQPQPPPQPLPLPQEADSEADNSSQSSSYI